MNEGAKIGGRGGGEGGKGGASEYIYFNLNLLRHSHSWITNEMKRNQRLADLFSEYKQNSLID